MDKPDFRKTKKTSEEILNEICGEHPDAHLLFVGSPNCLRHRPYAEIGNLMRERRASLLCPSMTDFSTGRYLRQVKEAVTEISAECGSRHFVLMFGCQWVILSSDGTLLRRELQDELGIEIRFHDASHISETENCPGNCK